MTRPLREDVAGAVHHLFAHVQNGEALYRDDVDRLTYLQLLAETTRHRRWRCLSYCLMPSHVHLLLETREANLSAGVRALHGSFASEYNRRHERSGHLFRGRFGAVRAMSTEQVWTAAVYIAANPVAAGLCERAEDWRWSSHGCNPPPGWVDVPRLHWYFESLGGGGSERYRQAVDVKVAAVRGARSGR